jgi:hypothetical protein
MATNNAINVPALTTNGQLWIGSTGTNPSVGTITGGSGISVVNGPGTITVSQTGDDISWSEVTGTSQAIAVNSGYLTNNAALVTLTLPVTSALFTKINVVGKGSGGWKIAQNAGQSINLGITTTTTGTGGSLASTNQYDSIELICTVANTTWTQVVAPQGNITVV